MSMVKGVVRFSNRDGLKVFSDEQSSQIYGINDLWNLN